MSVTGHAAGLWPIRRDAWKLIAVSVAIVAAMAAFHQFPYIDIAASRLFFDPLGCADAGGAPCTFFPAYESKALETLRFGLQYAQFGAVLCLAIFLFRRYMSGASIATPGFAPALAALISYILCVGLLINLVLKDHWGRPRPFQTDFFGGASPFVPAGQITDYCSRNCSFVSGEAASAFWLVCLATLLPARWRKAGIVAAIAVALLTSLLRISFGMHFLSDVVISWLLIGGAFIATRLVLTRIAERQASARVDP